MSDIITTLHPENDENTNLYPNIKKENVPHNAIDYNKLDEDVKSLLDSINELHPSGVSLSTTILAKTSNQGIWVGSDTGHWYYWDGTQYVDGGAYMSNQNYDEIVQDIRELIQSRSFTVNAGAWHSSNADQLLTPVKSGEQYLVYISANNTGQFRLVTSSSESIVITSEINKFFTITASTDGIGFALGIQNNDTESPMNVTYSVIKVTSTFVRFLNYFKLDDVANGIVSKTFYTDGVDYHSANKDWMYCNFPNNTKLYLYASIDNVNHSSDNVRFVLRTSGNTTYEINTQFNTIIETTTQDIISVISLYFSSGISGNVTFYAFSDLSLINKFIDFKVNKITPLGVYGNTFYTDGASYHSSTRDRINFVANIHAGTKICLYTNVDDVNYNNTNMTYYLKTSSNTDLTIGAKINVLTEYTLPSDVVSLGIYVPAGISGNVSFYIFTNLSLLGKLMEENNAFIPYSYSNDANYNTKLNNYYSLLKKDTNAFQYLFFTDVHASGIATYHRLISTLENTMMKTSCEYIISGGDWLTNSDTQDTACRVLSILTGIMRDKFNNRYLPILGNHDTNYQGVDDDNNPNSGILSNKALRNILFADYENMYYTIKRNKTRLYVFDSGIDWETTMSDYRWEQVDWFANQLLNNNDVYINLYIHIFTNQGQADLSSNPIAQPLAENITLIANAFNNRTSITLNGHTYDFTNSTGKICFMHCGHSHYDANLVYNGIPIVITRNVGANSSYDVCYVDYDNSKLYLIRFGEGSNREINIL